MLILRGTKIKKRGTGEVGCFCPICRAVTLYRANQVREVKHIYYVSIGRGEHLLDEITCSRCGHMRAFQPGQMVPSPPGSVDPFELASRTGPMSANALTQRVELESRVARKKLTGSERIDAILEPIAASAYANDQLLRTGRRTKVSSVFQLLLIVGIFASPIMWIFHVNDRSATPHFPLAAVIGSLVTAILLCIVIQRYIGDRHAVAPKIVWLLAIALQPLNPNLEEIEQAIQVARSQNLDLAMRLNPVAVFSAIQNEQRREWNATDRAAKH